MRYQVIDGQTQAVVGSYATWNKARAKQDKLDMAYGAYRYFVRSVEVSK